MPKIIISGFSKGTENVVIGDCAGEVIRNRYEIDLKQTGALAVGDIIDLGPLPAFSTVADAILDADDLDTGGSPALTFDVGIMSGFVGEASASRSVGNELFAASNVGQAGGVARMTKSAGFRIPKTANDRSIGVKITAAAATQAATGKLALILFTVQ